MAAAVPTLPLPGQRGTKDSARLSRQRLSLMHQMELGMSFTNLVE